MYVKSNWLILITIDVFSYVMFFVWLLCDISVISEGCDVTHNRHTIDMYALQICDGHHTSQIAVYHWNCFCYHKLATAGFM